MRSEQEATIPEVIIVEKPIEVPVKEEETEPVTKETPKPAPPPEIFIKPAAAYKEYCSFAKKLETTENLIRLTTENFSIALTALASDSVQCIVTLDATIAKGKRLVPVILPQSYFAAIGMIGTGQTVQLDLNLLTLAGDTIEASLEYQATAMGPIANDTEFVRSMQLVRRIAAPCQTMEVAKRTLVLQIILTLNKGTGTSNPVVQTREIPRIDYVLENCA